MRQQTTRSKLAASVLDLQVAVGLRAEVALIEMVHAHETVLSSGCVTVAIWRDSDAKESIMSEDPPQGKSDNARVHGTEVTFDTADLLLKDLVPESCFEFSLPQRCRRYAHGVLTTTQQDVWLPACNRCTVQGRLRSVRFQNCQRLCFMQLSWDTCVNCARLNCNKRTYSSSLVFAACDEVRMIGTQLKVGNDIHVCPLVVEHLVTGLRVE